MGKKHCYIRLFAKGRGKFRLVTSVGRHTDRILRSVARPRVTFSRMSDAAAVQIKGLGARLCSATYASMAAIKMSTLRNTPRRIACVVMSRKNRSTIFSHDELVGV